MILVYDYMPRATLEDHLHKRGTCLTWLRRLELCLGAARGLDYLHNGTSIKHGVIHRDVKSSNILLHRSWAAKVSDFGLSKICSVNQSSTSVTTFVKGTFGYLDPHYYSTGKLTRKSDVYAFGVVLLEVLCGKRAVDTSIDEEQWGLAGWAQDSIKEGRLKQIVDSSLEGRTSFKCLKEFARLADQCLHSNPKQRPKMVEVVVGLESILALHEKAKTALPPVGMTIFGRNVPVFLYSNNGEHSGSVAKKLKSLDIYLYGVGGEDRMLRRFDFATLNVATENFSKDYVILQHDLCNMYKVQNGQEITIRRIIQYAGGRHIEEAIMNEVAILVNLEHENLFLVFGYCIYEQNCFSCTNATCLLDWNKRYKILLGVGRALLYLHKHAPILVIHCDLTPSKILLDESLDPKLFDFELARCLAINETNCIVNVIRGSSGFMAPEYVLDGHLSCKVDVYKFGMLVLQTISGTKLFHLLIRKNLQQYVERCLLEGTSFPIDPNIGVDSSSMTRFVEIGLLCIQPDVGDRPTVEEVIDMLLGASSLTLLLSEIRERKLSEIRNDINASIDDYDVSAVEEFILDLGPR